jgi:hypothetical protein
MGAAIETNKDRLAFGEFRELCAEGEFHVDEHFVNMAPLEKRRMPNRSSAPQLQEAIMSTKCSRSAPGTARL